MLYFIESAGLRSSVFVSLETLPGRLSGASTFAEG